MRLLPTGDGTLVRCEINATIGGRLAAEDGGAIERAAQALAEGFLRRLAAQTTMPDPLLAQPPRTSVEAVRPGLKTSRHLGADVDRPRFHHTGVLRPPGAGIDRSGLA